MAVCALPSPGNMYTYARWLQTALFYFLAHFIETAIFVKRLSKHGVTVGSVAWMKWAATCFVGGKFGFEHFDRVIAEGGVK
jgi:hypothetical protein